MLREKNKFFNKFRIMTSKDMHEMDFFFPDVRFFEKGVLGPGILEAFTNNSGMSIQGGKADSDNCSIVIVLKDMSLHTTECRKAA